MGEDLNAINRKKRRFTIENSRDKQFATICPEGNSFETQLR
jgi:hypothetical protein